MELELAGKKVLITGGSKGIGLACALGFAAQGANLALAARDVAALKVVTKQLRKDFDIEVTSHSCDLSRPEHQLALIDVVGHTDILINNAGAIPSGSLDQVDDVSWRTAWDLKVFGYINLARLMYPKMKQADTGVIVNIIGAAADRPQPDYVAGAAGNSALVGFTRALGANSMNDGIRVVGINPGLTLTDRMETLLRQKSVEQFNDENRWEELIPTNPEPADPEQIADVVVFLASERASHISGTTITVDGGASA